ncbi:MAG: class SAM-dependent methyltransferase [Chlamydiia bacterium]|nr:class SAM-dependent methyltransferase [Chlamydiia bacterium]
MNCCYVCKNSVNNSQVFAKEMFLGTREIFPYVLCSSCHSLSIEKIPLNLEELYAKYPGLKHPQRKSSILRNLLRRYMILHSNYLTKKLSNALASFDDLRIKAIHNCQISLNSHILDVGCGSGWFIYELQELGFKNSIGIDPGLDKDIFFKNGTNLYKKTIFDVNQKFDFISFHHSFEHLENPVEVLKKAASLLKDEGTCLIRIPNIDSWAFRFFKENWSGIHPPYHLLLPSKKGMEILCKNSGFEIVDIRWEQLVESFLRSTCYSLGFASHDEFGTRTMLKDKPLGNRTIPIFTKQEIAFWRAKTKKVLEDRLSDYVAYYLRKIPSNDS